MREGPVDELSLLVAQAAGGAVGTPSQFDVEGVALGTRRNPARTGSRLRPSSAATARPWVRYQPGDL
ncbi:hypothetical protein [Sorangium sp. So ce1099]|uniref:hypothetical protein n=1 Tax=Sorangium sp. So ce1099 TaxID=3133331 RepID=UPI003F64545B